MIGAGLGADFQLLLMQTEGTADVRVKWFSLSPVSCLTLGVSHAH